MKKTKQNPVAKVIHEANEDIVLEHPGGVLKLKIRPNKKHHRPLHHYAMALFSVLLLLSAVWALGIHYGAKVKIGSEVVLAHQPDSSLNLDIQDQAQAYRLAVAYPDGSHKSFSLADMGLQTSLAATVGGIRQDQKQFLNRLEWWRPVPAQLSVIATKQTNLFIAQHATVTIQPAKDATLSIVNNQVQVSNSTLGKHYGLIDPIDTVTGSAGTFQPAVLRLSTLATLPAVSTQQLASSQTKLKKILQQKVTFIIDNTKVQPTTADIADWIELTPKDSQKTVDITVDSGKILSYINKIAAASVHPPKAQVDITRSDGTTGVLVSGVSGTDVVDKTSASVDVAKKLLQGQGIQESLSISYAPYKTITAQDYPKWIEVDTANKRLYAYEGGDLVNTFLVSAGAPLTPTVTGQFAIYSKFVQQNMQGLNVDGTGYYQPNVPWVNYFYQDFAIHGNYWRPTSYFGNVNSSHGCVGLLDSDAEWVYSWAPIGTPVIVHT